MSDDAIYVNGVDGSDGSYWTPPLSLEQLARLAQGEKFEAQYLEELRARHEGAENHYGFVFGVDPDDLAQAGWGVIFPHDCDPAVIEALRPLLEHRQAQAGQFYREYGGALGYRPLDTARGWLARAPRNKGPGPADPERVPGFLLIVGEPEAVPFRFQYELDVNYAVGRICFSAPAEYSAYARSVLEAESKEPREQPRQAVFFGVRNQADRATQLSSDKLVKPLAEVIAEQHRGTWTVSQLIADQASKENLVALLSAPQAPSLLFTASHGVGFPNGHPRQLPDQGALLCQNWPGPLRHKGPVPPEFYLAGNDLSDDANLAGMIAINFACYGAGTPRYDDYAHTKGERLEIAPRAFVSGLARRALGHPNGGPLAVVGHVERAWTYSFSWAEAGADLGAFESMLTALLAGKRIGLALDFFNQRYADLAVALNGELEEIKWGAVPNELQLGNLWTAANDSRSYVILGDPAVRLS